MSNRTAYLSNYGALFYKETDVRVFAHYYTDDFYSEIRMIATRKFGRLDTFYDFVKSKELFSEINKKINGHLDGRIYKHDSFDIVLENIYKDINKILLAKEHGPISFQNIYVNKLPTDGVYFYYKFFNLELHHLFFKYHNDTFICRVFLFLINN